MAAFGIATLRIGGGTVGLCPLPLLAADRRQVADFAPALVVSLTGPEELAQLGAAGLPGQIAAMGVDWQGFAVPDFGIPAPGQDWPALSRRLHAVLDKGGRVLAHCRGGCGRSGMLVLRMMVEAGEDPRAALQRLRQARPCAVETEQQRVWAVSA